jgi:peptide/nickel transport system substrate-binding protein
VIVNGDYEATFHLSKPQPSLLPMLASGLSPVYPCHVSDKDMRTRPIGTGPFRFVDFKSHASITLARNPNYWKKGRPYLDGIEWRIVTSQSTRVLAFLANEFDMTAWCRPTFPSTSWSIATGRPLTISRSAGRWP